jgi:hypothetical protein
LTTSETKEQAAIRVIAEHVTEQVGHLLSMAEISPQSGFHLRSALDAAEVEGVGGILVVKVSPKNREFAQVQWHGGVSQEIFFKLG